MSLLTRFAAELRALFLWWVRDLQEIAEGIAARLLPRWRKPVLVRVGPDNVIALEELSSGARVILALSTTHVLTHETTLPLAAERELDAAINLHLERELPLPRAQLCIHWRVIARDRTSKRLRVRVHVVRRQQIEHFGEVVGARGLRLSRVAIATREDALEGDLLPRRASARPFRITPLDRRLAMLCAALAISACGVVAIQWAIERLTIRTELARVGAQAERTRALTRELRRVSAASDALAATMARPDAIDVLRALTKEVPADTWAYQVEVSATSSLAYQVKLAGYAPAATTFVDSLGKAPKFASVRLISATSAGIGTGRDRLTVTARFEP